MYLLVVRTETREGSYLLKKRRRKKSSSVAEVPAKQKRADWSWFSVYIRVRVRRVVAWLGSGAPESPDGVASRHEAG